jgi:hypothetical protein
MTFDGPEDVQRVVGENRWPMAAAVLAVIVLTLLIPHSLIVRPRWGVPIVEGVLLVAVIIGDPGKIDRRSRPVRALSISLIFLLVGTALWCTAQLIRELIEGGPATQSGGALLAAGGIVYLSNCIAFGLLYWELDSGGPAQRAHGLPAHPDFAFPSSSRGSWPLRTGGRSSSITSTSRSPPRPPSAPPTPCRSAPGTRSR